MMSMRTIIENIIPFVEKNPVRATEMLKDLIKMVSNGTEYLIRISTENPYTDKEPCAVKGCKNTPRGVYVSIERKSDGKFRTIAICREHDLVYEAVFDFTEDTPITLKIA